MFREKLNHIARETIKNNKYLTLSTTDGIIPWAAPVFFTVDNKYHIYYISQLDSLHTKHILINPHVAFAIFDSHQKEGSGNGVQGSGEAYLVPESKLEEAFKWYHTTYVSMEKDSFTGSAPYRFFKIVPTHIYVLDPKATVDKRIEVFL